MSAECGTLALCASSAPIKFKASVELTRGFCHSRSFGELIMAKIHVVEGDSIEDIDEALSFLCETLRTALNKKLFLDFTPVDPIEDEGEDG